MPCGCLRAAHLCPTQRRGSCRRACSGGSCSSGGSAPAGAGAGRSSTAALGTGGLHCRHVPGPPAPRARPVPPEDWPAEPAHGECGGGRWPGDGLLGVEAGRAGSCRPSIRLAALTAPLSPRGRDRGGGPRQLGWRQGERWGWGSPLPLAPCPQQGPIHTLAQGGPTSTPNPSPPGPDCSHLSRGIDTQGPRIHWPLPPGLRCTPSAPATLPAPCWRLLWAPALDGS